jgi:hypothetical protein
METLKTALLAQITPHLCHGANVHKSLVTFAALCYSFMQINPVLWSMTISGLATSSLMPITEASFATLVCPTCFLRLERSHQTSM